MTKALFCVGLLVCLSGCVSVTSYGEVKPIDPKPNWMFPLEATDVSTLTPDFRWEAEHPHASYDLAIWDCIGQSQSQGSRVVFKTGIAGNHWTLDKALEPGSTYYWSVKPSESKDWATYSNVQFYASGGWSNARNHLFKIKTPDK